jgi:hypothetical protein
MKGGFQLNKSINVILIVIILITFLILMFGNKIIKTGWAAYMISP